MGQAGISKKDQKNKIKYVRIYKHCYAPMTSTLEWLTSVFPAIETVGDGPVRLLTAVSGNGNLV